MNRRNSVRTLIALAALWGASLTPAAASEVLYDQTSFLAGNQSLVKYFDVESPGRLTVTLTNVDWPVPLSSLNMILSSARGLIAPTMGPGSASFDIDAGSLAAQWFGTAQGSLNLGVYSLKIEFTPAAVSAVPLPTSLLLLASGLALMFWQRRHRDRDDGITMRLA